MTQAPSAVFKIPTKSPQPARGKPGRPSGRAKAGRPAPGRVVANGTGRAATRGGGEVIELEYGITVYPAREEHGRWRAVWYEDGERQQCEAASEEKLAPKLEQVTERLQVGAPNMTRPGADLIAHYLDPDRLPVDERTLRRHRRHPGRPAPLCRPGPMRHRPDHPPSRSTQPHRRPPRHRDSRRLRRRPSRPQSCHPRLRHPPPHQRPPPISHALRKGPRRNPRNRRSCGPADDPPESCPAPVRDRHRRAHRPMGTTAARSRRTAAGDA